MSKITKGDVVLHTLSGLFYRCENQKHEKWMNESPFYRLVPKDSVPESYFTNAAKK